MIELLREMFNVARRWGLFEGENPAAQVTRFHEQARERFLRPEELRALNAALLAEKDWRWRAFWPLLLYLGLRRGELAGARWNQVDFETRTFTLAGRTTKSGQPHFAPIPGPAFQILSQLKSRGESEFLFPGRGKSSHIVEVKTAWAQLWKRTVEILVEEAERQGRKIDPDSIEKATPHDLRRTLGSWLAAQGVSLAVIGRALNHRASKATEVYARLSLDPVREALERNAALMSFRPPPSTEDAASDAAAGDAEHQ